jgi:hypothetical protein
MIPPPNPKSASFFSAPPRHHGRLGEKKGHTLQHRAGSPPRYHGRPGEYHLYCHPWKEKNLWPPAYWGRRCRSLHLLPPATGAEEEQAAALGWSRSGGGDPDHRLHYGADAQTVAYSHKTTNKPKKLDLELPGTNLDLLQPAIPAEWPSAARSRAGEEQSYCS